jgi:hypothetical protein
VPSTVGRAEPSRAEPSRAERAHRIPIREYSLAYRYGGLGRKNPLLRHDAIVHRDLIQLVRSVSLLVAVAAAAAVGLVAFSLVR